MVAAFAVRMLVICLGALLFSVVVGGVVLFMFMVPLARLGGYGGVAVSAVFAGLSAVGTFVYVVLALFRGASESQRE